MKLPNANNAIVEEQKITGYLLNRAHRFGANKAKFFLDFGFRAGQWQVFANALREHAQTHVVAKRKETRFGPRFEIDGELRTPDGRRPRIRTVWQLDHEMVAPRLITAYPLEVSYDEGT